MGKYPVVHDLLERLAPPGGDASSERIWRFSERMAEVYEEQMRQFDDDVEARQWRRKYSAENMPPPSDVQDMADIAAMLAFYSPTNFCKFQKLVTQQLLQWESRQERLNPYPFGASTITLLDIGAGLGIASLAAIDVLAAWTDILAQLGHRQLGISVKVISVEPDAKKQGPRKKMLGHLSRLLDGHSIAIRDVTEVIAPYPEPDCIRQILSAASGGSLAVCCMSNFVSSPCADDCQATESFSLEPGRGLAGIAAEYDLVEWSQVTELEENAAEYARATGQLLAHLPVRSRLLLASELKQRGSAARAFAGLVCPGLELLLQWNRVRFYRPRGSYWYSLGGGEQGKDPNWAVGFWSLAHWGAGSATLATDTPDAVASACNRGSGLGIDRRTSDRYNHGNRDT